MGTTSTLPNTNVYIVYKELWASNGINLSVFMVIYLLTATTIIITTTTKKEKKMESNNRGISWS